jgi:hypothetical protein
LVFFRFFSVEFLRTRSDLGSIAATDVAQIGGGLSPAIRPLVFI